MLALIALWIPCGYPPHRAYDVRQAMEHCHLGCFQMIGEALYFYQKQRSVSPKHEIGCAIESHLGDGRSDSHDE